MNTIWGIILTVIIYAITAVFTVQFLEIESLYLVVFIASVFTLITRFILAKALDNVEADFNPIREGLTIAILILLTCLKYN